MKKPVQTLKSTVSAKVSILCLFAYMEGTPLSNSVCTLGAMSWAFLEAMKVHGDPTYKEASHNWHRSCGLTNITQALHLTRSLLKASEYTQVTSKLVCISVTLANHRKVPQLCVGSEMDLDQPLIL